MKTDNSAHSMVFGAGIPTPPKHTIPKVDPRPSNQTQPERKAMVIDLTNRYDSMFDSWGGLF